MNEEYWKFAEKERDFNTTQAGIRNLASGWMLAAYGAIALLLRSDNNVTWLVSPAVLVGVISVMATLGLLILWINDQMVYQRLLGSGFIVALKMEYDEPQLPPLRHLMMYSAEGRGMSRWMTYFYSIPMWGFLVITVAATLLRQSIGSTSPSINDDRSLRILIILCIAQLCVTLWVQWKKSGVEARNLAALFGDEKFTAMFDGTDDARACFGEIVKKSSRGLQG